MGLSLFNWPRLHRSSHSGAPMTTQKPKPDIVFNVWDDGWVEKSVYDPPAVALLKRYNSPNRIYMDRVTHRIRVYLKTKKAA